MKRAIVLVVLLFVFACTPSTPETDPVQQDVSEPSAPVPESTGAVAGSPDAYRDLQTQDDTFEAMDDALNELE